MRHLLMRVAVAAGAAAVIAPVQAQVYAAPTAAPPAPAGYSSAYSFPGPTPEDAYRQGLINRWELQQLAGPLPPALQGPSVDGSKGSSNGGRGE